MDFNLFNVRKWGMSKITLKILINSSIFFVSFKRWHIPTFYLLLPKRSFVWEEVTLNSLVSNFPCLPSSSPPSRAKVVANQIRFLGDPGRICHREWRYFHCFAHFHFLEKSGQVFCFFLPYFCGFGDQHISQPWLGKSVRKWNVTQVLLCCDYSAQTKRLFFSICDSQTVRQKHELLIEMVLFHL